MKTYKALPWRFIKMPSPGEILQLDCKWLNTELPCDLDLRAKAFIDHAKTEHEKSVIRVAWKVFSDPYYSEVAEKYRSWDALEGAGFFDDTLSPFEYQLLFADLKAWYTPMPSISDMQKFKKMYKEGMIKKPVVLVMPAALAPTHEGHVKALLAARERAQQEGWTVLASYLSPSHDVYVSTKSDECAHWPALHRIEHARVMTQDFPGIFVDPWESMGVNVALNYVDVLERMSAIYSDAFGFMVQPVLVAGADNGGFETAFEKFGNAIFVSREGYVGVKETENVLFVVKSVSNLASRNIRKPPNSVCHYRGHLLRDDGQHALSTWFECGKSPTLLYTAWNKFHVEVCKAIRKARGEEWKIAKTWLGNQELIFEDLVQQEHEAGRKLGILDPCLNDTRAERIRISRVFSMSDQQAKHVRYFNHSPINIASSPSISKLLDDDSVTGSTFREASKRPDVIPYPIYLTMKDLTGHTTNDLDPIDLRDFLLGTADGGLVVERDSMILRVPYWFPFTNLNERASIPIDKQLEFTKDIIKANIEFFHANRMTVGDVSNLSYNFLVSVMEFEDHEDLEYVCTCLLDEI